MNELYHHGIKNMHWGIRNGPPYPLDKSVSRRIKKAAATAAKTVIGADLKPLNSLTNSTPKLRKAYIDMQSAGIKLKNGKYKYSSDDPELKRLQKNLTAKVKRYCDEYMKEYKKAPMTYKQSLNAQKGAIAGAALGIAVPVIIPEWLSIPGGYILGSKKK